MKKSVRLTNANRSAEWELSDARFDAERVIRPNKSKASTGVDAKRAERDLRDMLNVDGITYSGDLRARGANRDDIFTRDRHGNKLTIEVKHGGGSIAYACTLDMECFDERDRDLCLVGVDYVVYRVKADLTNRFKMARGYMVATRDDFLDMLEEYCHGKRGGSWETATKFNNSTKTAINIQSMYIEQFWTGMQSDPRAMCLWDFCTNILGRDPRWER